MEKNIINFNKPNIEDGYSPELINYVDRLITKHPLIGVEGKVSLNYTGATYTFDGKEYAVFLLIIIVSDCILIGNTMASACMIINLFFIIMKVEVI